MYYSGDIFWLQKRAEGLKTKRIDLKISEWAEKKRYLPKVLTSSPGAWSNKYAPFMVEIVDNLAPFSPVKDVVLRKAGQMMATTAVAENWIGYIIDVDPAPTLYLSGSEELAKNSVELRIDRLIENSELQHKIRVDTKLKTKKSGNTAHKKDFKDGFLLAYGGQSTAKMKFVSVKYLIFDELEEIRENLGNQGDPIKLAAVRQKGFDATRKTLYLSTPILKGGPIDRLFLLGDQRYYFVPCKFCGFSQILEFRGTREDSKKYGIRYEVEKNGVLIPDSVRYICKNCLRDDGWKNDDKEDFLNAFEAEWRPTAVAKRQFLRSYQLDGLYSPPGNYSWETMVQEWLECYSEVTKRIIDVEALKVFQNTGRGLPFEDRTEAPVFERVIHHRRGIYTRNIVPNTAALRETGSIMLLFTAAVDVHKRELFVEIKGWTANRGSYSIDWRVLEGETDNLEDKSWIALRDIIENETWIADDGKKYGVILTLIDAGYNTAIVYDFCSEYSAGVYAIMGREVTPSNTRMQDGFAAYTKKGLTAYNLTVTMYKDRLASYLRKDWNDGELQPIGYPNYPSDYGDDYFRQYNAEKKVAKIYTATGKKKMVWKQKKNSVNDAWDCAVYNLAALDMVCYDINVNFLNKDQLDYPAFWEYIIANKTFYNEKKIDSQE